MVIVMEPGAREEQIQAVVSTLESDGFKAHLSRGESQTVIGAVGRPPETMDPDRYKLLDGVHNVVRISEPYKLASRSFKKHDTIIDLGKVRIGADDVVVMAGPCTIESKEQVEEIAPILAGAGIKIMRGGAFKPRTSPYAFQGMGEAGLKILRDAADRHGMLTISEVMDHTQIAMMLEYVDILQVGTRNMQNFSFLKELGKTRKPILLKRGMSATLDELLLAAEYILSGGNPELILCERGIRTFSQATRNTLDLAAVPVLQEMTHLPIVVDPSHALGIRHMVHPMSLASIAAGADGLLIEVHPHPEKALCDGPQSLLPPQFTKLMEDLRRIAPIVGKTLA